MHLLCGPDGTTPSAAGIDADERREHVMARRKKISKEDIKAKLEPVGKKVEQASQVVGGIAKATAQKASEAGEKASEVLEATGEKAAQVGKKAVSAIGETGEKANEAGKKAAAAIIPEVYVQWGGKETSCAELLERAKTDFRANNEGAVHSCRLYIKPEDGLAYYVISGKEGKISL